MKIKTFTLSLIIFLFCGHTAAHAQTTTTTPVSTPEVLGLQVPEVPYIIQKIKEAKELLKPIKLNYVLSPVYKTDKKTKKKVVSRYNLGDRDLMLAILLPDGQIKITGAIQKGRSFVFPDKSYSISLTRFNGVNSRFKVTSPEGGKVVALKYLITPVESGSKSAIQNSTYEALYTPYSPELDQTDVANYGQKYLDNVISQVAEQLKNYPSVSLPGSTVTQAIRPGLIKALVYAEHMDTNELLNASDIKPISNRINTLFAINESETYRYSGSSAGALGISQFIESTYLGLVKRHTSANLIPDFKQGMADHINSIKSTYLLLDDYIHAVRDRAEGAFTIGQAFDYGVAAYNGGVVRVARALNNFGSNWNQDRSGEISSTETQIKKMSAEIESLRKKTLATSEKKARAQLQSKLDNMRTELASMKDRLTSMQNATLRDETRGYLQKIYKVVSSLNT
ncbi:MAG: hypothetical protein JNN11_01870 [Candidatus Doudnabacteria bacterium]|nr:hypothetical protein [Candidatus Doudnabacteria bacterium]